MVLECWISRLDINMYVMEVTCKLNASGLLTKPPSFSRFDLSQWKPQCGPEPLGGWNNTNDKTMQIVVEVSSSNRFMLSDGDGLEIKQFTLPCSTCP
jgi:hypothetical protein